MQAGAAERINAEANRKGGANKYAKFGLDQTDLFLAELLAATRWTDETMTDDDLVNSIVAICKAQALSPPRNLCGSVVRDVRNSVVDLCLHWMQLIPKGALNFTFDPSHPESGLQRSADHFGSAPRQ